MLKKKFILNGCTLCKDIKSNFRSYCFWFCLLLSILPMWSNYFDVMISLWRRICFSERGLFILLLFEEQTHCSMVCRTVSLSRQNEYDRNETQKTLFVMPPNTNAHWQNDKLSIFNQHLFWFFMWVGKSSMKIWMPQNFWSLKWPFPKLIISVLKGISLRDQKVHF